MRAHPTLVFGATGIVAMAMFWGFSLSPPIGIGTLAAVMLTATVVIVGSAFKRDARLLQSLAPPLTAWLIFGLLILSIGAAIDNGGGHTAANTAFYPVTWSTDNHLPVTLAQVLARGVPLSEFNFGSWLVSDRPAAPVGVPALH